MCVCCLFLVAITWEDKQSLTTCNLTCEIMQYTVFSPEGQEVEKFIGGKIMRKFIREGEHARKVYF